MQTEPPRVKWLRYAAAGLSIVAGLIHGLVTPEHFEEWWGYGLFFLIATLAQIAFGIFLLLKPWSRAAVNDGGNAAKASRRTIAFCLAGIVGNLFVIALWIVTRTAGIPFFGPEAGVVEEMTLVSVVSKVIEAALIVCLFLLIQSIRTLSRPLQRMA